MKKKKPLILIMPESLHSKIKTISFHASISMGEYVRKAITEKMERDNAKSK